MAGFNRRTIIFIFLAWGLALRLFPATMAQAETANTSPPPPPSDIQKAIDVLENEQSRQDMITLLRLLNTLDQQRAEAAASQADNSSGEKVDDQSKDSVKTYLSDLTDELWREVKISGLGLRQTWRAMGNIFQALSTPQAVDIWRPYLLKIFLWGLACLLATFLIIKKYGKLPDARPNWSWWKRLQTAGQYVLIVAGPNLVLIMSLMAVPQLSTTQAGITADLATGFSFIQALVKQFFINLSALYIGLEASKVLFTPGRSGYSIVPIHPVLSRHFKHSFRVFASYVAFVIFFKETFMEHFVDGSLYPVLLILLTLPSTIYLTARIKKLGRLVLAISEAEASAGIEDEADISDEDLEEMPEAGPARFDYQTDLFLKKHWNNLSIMGIWGLGLLFLFNPLEASDNFIWRFMISLSLIGLGALSIKFLRRLMLRFGAKDTESGRRLLLQSDLLANMLVWASLGLTLLALWGLPLGRFLGNVVVRDVAGRATAIFIILGALIIFVKFSRTTTDWLLASPQMTGNRNWRTMTPLLLTAVRSLAVFVGVVAILERLGVNVGPILAGAGILGLGVGMGAQSLVKDVINGISILLMDTLSVGDYVTIGGKSGSVEVVGLRSIRLRDAAGNLTVVPNSMVDTIVNMTRDYSQDLVEFIAPYDADPDVILKLATEVAAELSQDEAWQPSLTGPISVVGITAFDANGTTIRLKVNTTSGHQWSVGRELRLRLKRRMLNDGFKSPWFGQNIFLHQGNAK